MIPTDTPIYKTNATYLDIKMDAKKRRNGFSGEKSLNERPSSLILSDPRCLKPPGAKTDSSSSCITFSGRVLADFPILEPAPDLDRSVLWKRPRRSPLPPSPSPPSPPPLTLLLPRRLAGAAPKLDPPARFDPPVWLPVLRLDPDLLRPVDEPCSEAVCPEGDTHGGTSGLVGITAGVNASCWMELW